LKIQSHFLFPFDLGLELDFTGEGAEEIFKEISSHKTARLFFEGRDHGEADVSIQVYKFGVGVIHIVFHLDVEISQAARLSCFAESVQVGHTPVVSYCQGLVHGVVKTASKFATYRYDKRFEEEDLIPVFVLGEGLDTGTGHTGKIIKEADAFIRKHRKALYGIVLGEPRYEDLSEFVLEREQLQNYGYYENEIILVERFGALIYSPESATILELIKLNYALYWSLKSYNFILDHELDSAQRVLEHLPPYYKFWRIPGQYQKFSVEAMDFSRDKLAIVESLYTVSMKIPRIDADWHLRTLYGSLRKAFTIDEWYRTVETKLERIEESYNSAREFLSTNFFILLDIIFFASLAWAVIDTCLLYNIATR
jgi:hypothetical protein